MTDGGLSDDVARLISRSKRLGSDRTVTNFAGGNTSVKTTVVNPATGNPVEVLYVKGSGGDLGTLKPAGLAVLDLEKVVALDEVYQGASHEDEMVELLQYCRFGTGGAAPSIDTPLHALVRYRHVDHLHPDAVIAIACATDGERITRDLWQGKIAWVGWRRPGWELGRIMREVSSRPGVIGAVMGGHGVITWGDTSEEVEHRSLATIRDAAAYIANHSVDEPLGALDPSRRPLAPTERRARAAKLFPYLRAAASRDARAVGHFDDSESVLDFLARAKAKRLVQLGTSCPDHFLRTKIRPLLLDTPPDLPLEDVCERLHTLEAAYRAEYEAYYERHREPDSPPMRGASPAIILVPGIGMFSFGADAQTARVAGEFYGNAINVMRGAEGISEYAPIAEAEKFRIEYWALEEAKLRRRPKPRPHAGRIAFVSGGASGIGLATARALAEDGAHVVIADLAADRAARVASDLGDADRAVAVTLDVTNPQAVAKAIDAAVLAFGGIDLVVNSAGISRAASLASTTEEDWDLQYRIMPRGSFLVVKAIEPVLRAQEMGGDIIIIASKNAVFAGQDNIAYSSAKAAQAHMVRLLAAELGEIHVRVNGINPDGVVRGSGIFAGGWGAARAKLYGVPESELGKYYAQRTLLKTEVLPEHVASAVVALTGDAFPVTTGHIVPVDSGVPQAFLR